MLAAVGAAYAKHCEALAAPPETTPPMPTSPPLPESASAPGLAASSSRLHSSAPIAETGAELQNGHDDSMPQGYGDMMPPSPPPQTTRGRPQRRARRSDDEEEARAADEQRQAVELPPVVDPSPPGPAISAPGPATSAPGPATSAPGPATSAPGPATPVPLVLPVEPTTPATPSSERAAAAALVLGRFPVRMAAGSENEAFEGELVRAVPMRCNTEVKNAVIGKVVLAERDSMHVPVAERCSFAQKAAAIAHAGGAAMLVVNCPDQPLCKCGLSHSCLHGPLPRVGWCLPSSIRCTVLPGGGRRSSRRRSCRTRHTRCWPMACVRCHARAHLTEKGFARGVYTVRQRTMSDRYTFR